MPRSWYNVSVVYVGLDIGGTKTMAAAATGDGRIGRRARSETPRSLREGIEMLKRLTLDVAGGERIAAIGAAVGGPLDFKTGTVSPLHQPEWRGVPLASIMTETFECPFYVDVDTNIAAIGEYFGHETPPGKLLYLTLSTGMGGGFVVDGKIYRGLGGAHPEVAHQSINYRCTGAGVIECECGASDCLEALVSGNGIARIYGKPASQLSDVEWDEVAFNLGQGLRNLATIYLPDAIVLGGGVAVGGGESFIRNAAAVMRARLNLVPAPNVALSTFGYDTALIGAVHVSQHGLSG